MPPLRFAMPSWAPGLADRNSHLDCGRGRSRSVLHVVATPSLHLYGRERAASSEPSVVREDAASICGSGRPANDEAKTSACLAEDVRP